jgi:hypothetical protein
MNIGMEVLSVLLFIIYSAWALISKWFNIDNKEDVESLKQALDSVELYVKSVEYTSLAMIPIQITVILIVRCWCGECARCRDKMIQSDPEFAKQMNSMSMGKSQFTL